MKRMDIVAGLVALLVSASTRAEDWPRFRGPNGSGVSSSVALPETLDPERAVWRAATPPGTSSPVVAGGRVFLTGHEGRRRLTLCLDARTGDLLWSREVEAVRDEPFHPKTGPTAPTPATDGENVYVLFPDFGLLAYGSDGGPLWSVPLGPFRSIYGVAVSPIVVEGQVIVKLDQLSGSSLAAFRAASGEKAWERSRPASSGAYSTPFVVKTEDGTPQIIAPGSHQLVAYASGTGEPAWSVPGLPANSFPSPVADDRDVYLVIGSAGENPPGMSHFDADGDGYALPEEVDPGFREIFATWASSVGDRDGRLDAAELSEVTTALWGGPEVLLAIALDAEERQQQPVRWSLDKAVPTVPSPLLFEGLVYLVKNGGILTAVDPATGELVKMGRLRGGVGAYFASPVAGAGKIYLASESGTVSVVDAGPDWDLVSSSDFDEPILATPALSAERVFIRTESALYAFASESQAP